MIRIYCRGQHKTKKQLCPECSELLEYALFRLEECPFGSSKPACNKCPIHCYKPDMKGPIRDIMRYAGPRMLLPHPVLTLFHFIDEQKKITSHKKKVKTPK